MKFSLTEKTIFEKDVHFVLVILITLFDLFCFIILILLLFGVRADFSSLYQKFIEDLENFDSFIDNILYGILVSFNMVYNIKLMYQYNAVSNNIKFKTIVIKISNIALLLKIINFKSFDLIFSNIFLSNLFFEIFVGSFYFIITFIAKLLIICSLNIYYSINNNIKNYKEQKLETINLEKTSSPKITNKQSKESIV